MGLTIKYTGGRMRLEPTAKPDQVLRVNSRLITASTILHFTSDELERAISQEQLENPRSKSLNGKSAIFAEHLYKENLAYRVDMQDFQRK
jgi:RNA polymerase sigma-54 factor